MATSRLSSYVHRIRRLQTLKTDDAFCLLEMRHSGLFLLFSDHDKPLLTKSKASNLYTIPEIPYGELSEEYFSHELHPEGNLMSDYRTLYLYFGSAIWSKIKVLN